MAECTIGNIPSLSTERSIEFGECRLGCSDIHSSHRQQAIERTVRLRHGSP
jgi:hypothetical protein